MNNNAVVLDLKRVHFGYFAVTCDIGNLECQFLGMALIIATKSKPVHGYSFKFLRDSYSE